MKKTLLLIIILLHSVVKSQTFNGNLGSQSLNWATEQKDFNALPRVGVAPMSLKLWDNYGGTNAPSTYGTLMEIYGKSAHLVSQVYFQSTWEGGRMMYRSAFYNQTAWSDWRKLLDSKSDVESSGSLKITGTANNYIMNGNLGIGTTTPNSLTILDVNGRAAVRSIFYVNDIMGGNGGDIRIGPNTGQASSTIFMIGGVDASEVMRINYNKNVGIGTTAPDEKLTVKGKIHAQEVRVDMSGPLVPDYVFAEDYKLKSLKEVEDFIKENKHLPENSLCSGNREKRFDAGRNEYEFTEEVGGIDSLYDRTTKKEQGTNY